MPRTATLAEMRSQVRRETDQEQSTFVSDAEINRWLNQGIAEVWRLLVNADPNRGLVSTTIATTTGTTEYALPSGFMAIRGLDYPLGDGRYCDVQPYAFTERNQLQSPLGTLVGTPCRYLVLRGDVSNSTSRLSLLPDPGTASYRLWYVGVPATLSLDADTFDGIIGFEDYAVAWACERVRRKAEEDPSPHTQDQARIEVRIQQEAGRRDRSGNEHVARVRSRSSFYSRF